MWSPRHRSTLLKSASQSPLFAAATFGAQAASRAQEAATARTEEPTRLLRGGREIARRRRVRPGAMARAEPGLVLHRRVGRGMGLGSQRRGRRSTPGLVECRRWRLLPAVSLHLQLGSPGQQRWLRGRADRLHAVEQAVPVPVRHSILRLGAGIRTRNGVRGLPGDAALPPLGDGELHAVARPDLSHAHRERGHRQWHRRIQPGLQLLVERRRRSRAARRRRGVRAVLGSEYARSRSLPIWPQATTSRPTTCSRSATSCGTSPPTSTS